MDRTKGTQRSKTAKGLPFGMATFLVIFCVGSSVPLSSQSVPGLQPGKSPTGAQEPLRSARASRVDRAPKLDGTLNDPLWQQVTPISNFLQREPFEGQTPTEHTEVRILYSKLDIYFGITCFDSE